MRVPGLWRNRDFTVLWSGRAVSDLGSAMSFVAMPLVTLAVGSTVDAGLVLATATVTSLVVVLYAGAVVDRFNRRTIMIATVLVRATAFISVVLALSVGRLTVIQLYVVAAALGASSPFFSAAETAAIRLVVAASDLPDAYAQNQVRSFAAELVGSPAGGALYALGRAVPFAVDALTFVLEAIALLAIRTPLSAPKSNSEIGHVRSEIGTGLRFVWHNEFLRTAIIAGGTINFASMWPALLITLHDRAVPPALIGAALAGISAASVCGAFLAPWASRKWRPGRVLLVAVWWLVAAMAAMTIDPATPVLLGALILAMAAIPVAGVLLSSYESTVTPDTHIGRVSSANRFVAMLAVPAGQALGGVLIKAGGPHLAFGIYGIAVLAGAGIMTASRAVRQLPVTQPA